MFSYAFHIGETKCFLIKNKALNLRLGPLVPVEIMFFAVVHIQYSQQ